MGTWVPGVVQVPTRKLYPPVSRNVLPIDLLLFHYTAGIERPRWNLLQRATAWAQDATVEASTHTITARDPRKQPTIQLMPLECRAWHAGSKAIWRERRGVNGRSIGIDADNVGPLTISGSGFIDWAKRPYTGPAPFQDEKGGYWEPYPEEQVLELCRVVRFVAETFPIVATDYDRLTGHENVSATKRDPGPAFGWVWSYLHRAARGETIVNFVHV